MTFIFKINPKIFLVDYINLFIR